MKATINLIAGVPANLDVIYSNVSAMEKSVSQPALMLGLVSVLYIHGPTHLLRCYDSRSVLAVRRGSTMTKRLRRPPT